MPGTTTASWALEFVLRQPIEDWLANEIFHALPVSPPLSPRLMRILLLRRIASQLSRRFVSDRILHSLELLHQLDLSVGDPQPSDSLRAAYCAVAVECTAVFLRNRPLDDLGEFFDAVNRIWNCRVGDLERSEAAGLVSEELKRARREMEAAVVDSRVRVRVKRRGTEKEALDTVRAYLKEEIKKIGPSFLEFFVEVISGSDGNAMDPCLMELKEKLFHLPVENHSEPIVEAVRDVPSSKPGILPTPEVMKVKEELKESDVPGNKLDLLPISVEMKVKKELRENDIPGSKLDDLPMMEVMKVSDDPLPVPAVMKVKEEATSGLDLVARDTIPDPLTTATGTLETMDEQKLNLRENVNSYAVCPVGGISGNKLVHLPTPTTGVMKVKEELQEYDVPVNKLDDLPMMEAMKVNEKHLPMPGMKMKEEPTSCLDLVVRDPIPDSVTTASRTLTSMTEQKVNLRENVSSHNVCPVQGGVSGNKVDHLLTPGVTRVKEELSTSGLDMQMVVRGLLPDVVTITTGVPTRMAKQIDNSIQKVNPYMACPVDKAGGANPVKNKDNETVLRPCAVVKNASLIQDVGVKQNIVRVSGMSFIEKASGACGLAGSDITSQNKNSAVAQKRSIMDRSPTARTDEWDDDSIESSSSSTQEHIMNLLSLKGRGISSVKIQKNTELAGRRKPKRWSTLEEETLRKAVERNGKGNWKLIKSLHPEIFEERTVGDLKDKWRNMTKQ